MFDEPPIWSPISLEGPYIHDGILTIYLYSYNHGPMLVIFMSTYLLPHCLQKVQPTMFTGDLLEG